MLTGVLPYFFTVMGKADDIALIVGGDNFEVVVAIQVVGDQGRHAPLDFAGQIILPDGVARLSGQTKDGASLIDHQHFRSLIFQKVHNRWRSADRDLHALHPDLPPLLIDREGAARRRRHD